jgi:hypothetical protein
VEGLSVLAIRGLSEWRNHLARLDLGLVRTQAAQSAAEQIATKVREGLSVAPGGPHARPWLRSGNLRQSIASEADEAGAVIGSTSSVAVDQELGTSRIPPRPFLAPAAAQSAPTVVEAIGAAVAQAMRGVK